MYFIHSTFQKIDQQIEICMLSYNYDGWYKELKLASFLVVLRSHSLSLTRLRLRRFFVKMKLVPTVQAETPQP